MCYGSYNDSNVAVIFSQVHLIRFRTVKLRSAEAAVTEIVRCSLISLWTIGLHRILLFYFKYIYIYIYIFYFLGWNSIHIYRHL